MQPTKNYLLSEQRPVYQASAVIFLFTLKPNLGVPARTALAVACEAELSKVSARTIAHFEAGNRVPHDRTLRDIQRALEEMGIEFVFEGAVGIGIRVRRATAGRTAISRTRK
jgi:hypothetical protein